MLDTDMLCKTTQNTNTGLEFYLQVLKKITIAVLVLKFSNSVQYIPEIMQLQHLTKTLYVFSFHLSHLYLHRQCKAEITIGQL